jgi:hypothetical protein
MLIPEADTNATRKIHGRAGVTTYRIENKAGANALAIPHENS